MKKLTVLGIIGGAALLAAVPLSFQLSQRSVTLSVDTGAFLAPKRSAESRRGILTRLFALVT